MADFSVKISKSKTPQQADWASNLQRSRAAGYPTLAAVAKYPRKRGFSARCSRE